MSLSKNKKNFCVISTSRAELGILRNLIARLQKIKKIKTDLLLIDKHNVYVSGKSKGKFETKDYKIKNIINIRLPNKTTSSTSSFIPIKCASVPPIWPAPIKAIFFIYFLLFHCWHYKFCVCTHT